MNENADQKQEMKLRIEICRASFAKLKKSLYADISPNKRKLEYFAHRIRGSKYALLQIILEGKIKEKRSQEGRKPSWHKNLRD